MERTGVLFVCLGNICRSPMAEGIFQHLVDQRGLTAAFRVESAGTAAYHIGKRAHPLTREVLAENGVDHRATARQVSPEDFDAFDVILAMDRQNLRDLERIAPANAKARLALVLEPVGGGEVPDPYDGDRDGYERNYDLLLPALEAWLDRLRG